MKKLLRIIILLCALCMPSYLVMAEDDSYPADEVTNTFYRDKSTFTSEFDYKVYCEKMYNWGYMDEKFEWTPAAKDYINDMTVENYKKLDEDARAKVEERIEEDKMEPEDSPYITYEERQAIIEEKNPSGVPTGIPTEKPVPTGTPSGEPAVNVTTEPTVEPTAEPTIEPTAEPTEEPTEEPAESSSIWGMLSKVVIVVLSGAVALIAYFIYRKQF